MQSPYITYNKEWVQTLTLINSIMLIHANHITLITFLYISFKGTPNLVLNNYNYI